MTDILFSHSYFLRFDPKQWKHMQPYPPLGTIYAASVLRNAGYSVALFDVMFAKGPDELTGYLEKHQPKVIVFYDDCFNYLTKMCLTNMRHAVWKMAKMAKQQGCKVIVSSSDSTDHREKYLQNGADYVILGEGEVTLNVLVDVLTDKVDKSIEAIPGLAYLEGGTLKETGNRPVMTNLDELPLPAWDLIDIENYRAHWQKRWGYFSLNQVTTRGCPYKCNWCAKPIYGNRYNTRSPEKAVEELVYVLKTFQPDHIWFCDDIFGLKPGWVQEFNKLVQKQKLDFKYKIQSRVDLVLKEDTAKCLAESGCETIWLGAESGSQKVLDAMDKGTTVEQIYEARKVLKKYGVRVAFFLQYGYLGETKEDIEKTFTMLSDLVPDEIGISVSYPLPGTKFYDKVKEELQDKTNWTDSDDLALMFRNNFSPDYYRKLQKYTHKFFQKQKGIENLKLLLKQPWKLSAGKLRSVLAMGYYVPAAQMEKQALKKLEINS